MATATAAPPKDQSQAELQRRMLRQMLLIRRFEEKAAEAYALGKIGGFCHLYIGQEAVAVGSLNALRDDDYVICSYREHGQALVRGIPATAVMAELFGKATGCSRGKGGSMHLFDAGKRFMGGHGIVGGHIPLAAGLGFAIKYRDGDQLCLCYFGEAAVNIGAFHEALNMASVWKLPVIFCCENNRYGMGTAFERVAAVTDVVEHACSYDLAAELVNGMGAMQGMTYGDALNQALREEMQRDADVFLMGEEVGVYQGAYKVSRGLLEEFGPKRVVDTPIAELGFAGIGVGAAMAGLRPVVEFMTWNFAVLALDQIVNSAAKLLYMTGGQLKMPIVFRGPNGAALQLGSQHSQAWESWLAHIPGLKVVAPATPADAKGLLKSAIRDNNPVIVLEGEMLYNTKGEVPEGEYVVPIGRADVKRAGRDVTLICHSKTVAVALNAAEQLAEQERVSAEVVDLRSLRPLDDAAITASVAKTNRAVVIEEGWPHCGIGAQVVDVIQREAFDHLDAPVLRVTQADVPMPYNKQLERRAKPSPDKVVAAARRVLYLD